LRIGYSVNEIRHLLGSTVWAAVNHIEHVLSWSAQRLAHQTRAMISHYRRRGDPLPRNLLRI
jgi:hypothetical protein